MQEVLQQADSLAEGIKKSRSYIQFQTLYEELRQDQGLLERVNAYRRNKFIIQTANSNEMLAQLDSLSHEYEDILSKQLVKNFLAAELRYCRMIRLVKEKVISAAQIDINFLEG